MVGRLIPIAVIVVVLGLAGAVNFIHRGATAKLEAENLLIAGKVQRESTEEVLKLAENARQERDERIVELEAAVGALPQDNTGAGQPCPSACSLVWKVTPVTPVLRDE